MKTLSRALVALLTCTLHVSAQTSGVVRGYVYDRESGERLPGAVVRSFGTNSHTVTNDHGYFALRTGTTDSTRIGVSLLGYLPYRETLLTTGDVRLDIPLTPSPIEQPEVLVLESGDLAQGQPVSPGRTFIRTDLMKAVPVTGGELDVVKVLQTTAGVQGGNELDNTMNVRGGSHDQNLILVDGIPVYNVNHLFGYFSIFQPEAIRSIELLRGGIPAAFGGRLSSVLRVNLKEGNRERFSFSGGISMIAARAVAEGPLPGNMDGSFLVAARRTYLDPLLSAAARSSNATDLTNVSFYDLTLKANAAVNERNQLFVSGYFGGDRFTLRDKANELSEEWGNAAYAVRLNSLWSGSVFTNLTIVYSEYRDSYLEKSPLTAVERKPNVRDIGISVDANHALTTQAYVSAGLSLTTHRYTIFSALPQVSSTPSVRLESTETNGFVSLDWDIAPGVRISPGSRVSHFGLGDHWGYEPRLTVLVSLTPATSVTVSYDRTVQFVHSLSSASLTTPGELYYPSTSFLRPQVGDQAALGFSVLIDDPLRSASTVNITVDTYYRHTNRLPQLRYDFVSISPDDLPDELLVGEGRQYGMELSVNRTDTDFPVRINYSWSRSIRRFPERNRGISFPATFHREHQLALSAEYRVSDSWTLAATFILASGQPITLPKGRISFNGLFPNVNYVSMVDYGGVNAERLPAYNRLDLGATYAFALFGAACRAQVNIHNAYGYPNPMFNYFDLQSDRFEQVSLGFLPTLGISFTL